MAQVAHGIAEFSIQHHRDFQRWVNESNYIVVLQVPDEEALLWHADVLSGFISSDLAHVQNFTLVHEPDIDAHTVIVVSPGSYHTRLSGLPLAGKELAIS